MENPLMTGRTIRLGTSQTAARKRLIFQDQIGSPQDLRDFAEQ